MAASAKACWVATVWEHGGCKRKGVERPWAVRGPLGRVRKQSRTAALRATVVVFTAAACTASKERRATPALSGVFMMSERTEYLLER